MARQARRRLPLIVMAVAVGLLLVMPTLARNQLGVGVTTVLTGSMRPAIDPGDLVVTRITQGSAVATGDVVVVTSGNEQVAHRVVEIRPLNGLNRLTTKGDANPTIDIDPVMLSSAAGVPRVVWRIPNIGMTLAWLASPDAQRLAVTLLIGANLMALALLATRRRPREQGDTTAPSQPADIESVDA